MDLALNNLQSLIFRKTQINQTKPNQTKPNKPLWVPLTA